MGTGADDETGPDGATAADGGAGAGGRGPDRTRRPRGRVLVALAVLLACLLLFPGAVPNTAVRLGSLTETFLPWLGLAVLPLLVLARVRRSRPAAVALLAPATVWLALFGPSLLPGADGGPGDLTAVQHNVSDVNPDPAGTAEALLGADADLIALEELTPAALPAYTAVLARDLPHHAAAGTVGLWSRYPLTDVRPVDLRPRAFTEAWNRGLRATAATPHGPVAVYVAHLPSVRLGPGGGFDTARRDESARLLARAVAADPLARLILLGDLNSTVDDRGLAPVTDHLETAGRALAFTWPASLPLARIDQILTRAAPVAGVRTLPATGSDHLPLTAEIRLRPAAPGGRADVSWSPGDRAGGPDGWRGTGAEDRESGRSQPSAHGAERSRNERITARSRLGIDGR